MGSRRFNYTAKPRNFFKPILFDNAEDTGLRIPKKFAKYYRKKLPLNDVLLIVPDDTVWSLDWTISDDGELWLKKGWPEFAQHYCLGLGYLLVFNYLGKCVFHVQIFDPSNCEIDYLSPTKFPIPKTGIDPSSKCIGDCKLKAKVKPEENECASSDEEVKGEVDLEMEKEIEQRSSRALELPKAFESDNPFYLVTIRSSSLERFLYLPSGFARKYLTKCKSYVIDCVFQLPDGGNWAPVKCRAYRNYGKFYGDGWNRFCDDNRLAKGDVCVLELVNDIENVLKVTIFRAQEDDPQHKV